MVRYFHANVLCCLLPINHRYLQEAKGVYESAKRAQAEGDEEQAYVTFGHFLQVFGHLDGSLNFHKDLLEKSKADERTYQSLLDRKEEAKKRRDTLGQSLRKRYEEKREEEARYLAELEASKNPIKATAKESENGQPSVENSHALQSMTTLNNPKPKKEAPNRPLSLATAFSDLQAMCLTNENISQLLHAAKILGAYDKILQDLDEWFEEAEQDRLDGNQEKAYIGYANFVKCYKVLEDCPEIETSKLDELQDKYGEALFRENRLERALRKRYETEKSDIPAKFLTDDEFAERVTGLKMGEGRELANFQTKFDHPIEPIKQCPTHDYEDREGYEQGKSSRRDYMSLEWMRAPQEPKPLYMGQHIEELKGFVAEARQQIEARLYEGLRKPAIYRQ